MVCVDEVIVIHKLVSEYDGHNAAGVVSYSQTLIYDDMWL